MLKKREQDLHPVHLDPFESYSWSLTYQKMLRNMKMKHENYLSLSYQSIKKYSYSWKRISFVASINNQKVSNLLIVNLNHLNSNIVAECVFSLFSKKK